MIECQYVSFLAFPSLFLLLTLSSNLLGLLQMSKTHFSSTKTRIVASVQANGNLSKSLFLVPFLHRKCTQKSKKKRNRERVMEKRKKSESVLLDRASLWDDEKRKKRMTFLWFCLDSKTRLWRCFPWIGGTCWLITSFFLGR